MRVCVSAEDIDCHLSQDNQNLMAGLHQDEDFFFIIFFFFSSSSSVVHISFITKRKNMLMVSLLANDAYLVRESDITCASSLD